MAYLIPYGEVFRGRSVTEPSYLTMQEYESRSLIPQIAEQVSGWEFLTNFLGKAGNAGKDILSDPDKLNALAGLISAIKGQGNAITSTQQSALGDMGFSAEQITALLGLTQQHSKEIPDPSFMQKYGGWIIGGGLGIAALLAVGLLLKR